MREVSLLLPDSNSAPAGDSRPVASSQQGPHPRLAEVVRRHLEHPWRQPLHAPSAAAFGATQELLEPGDRERLVLDSGCGTGASTRLLARHHPGCVVIGVDRSRVRLARGGAGAWPRREGRVILVRAELATFWRLALDAGWRLAAHWLLYPNPWPKPGHLGRRWHAHPAFPALLALGGELVLRCNWRVYAEEFALALEVAGGRRPPVRAIEPREPLSLFERKYRASGHALYELRVNPAA